MASTPQQMIIEAFNTLALYSPQSASEMEQHLAADHEMWQQIASSLRIWSGRITLEMPYGPATSDSIGDLAAATASISELAQGVHQTFRSEHEVELQRIEAPRADEGQWDIGRQG